MNEGGRIMNICEVYYHKYKGDATPERHYIPWAISLLEKDFDTPSLCILAGLQPPFNEFEVNKYLKNTLRELSIYPPTFEQCITQLTYQHLLTIYMDASTASYEAARIVNLAFEHRAVKNLHEWREISDSTNNIYARSYSEQEIKALAKEEIDRLLFDTNRPLLYKRY